MVVLSQPVKHINLPPVSNFTQIPVVDLLNPSAKTQIVKACQEFGFFKVINHGVPIEMVTTLESQALSFFNLSQTYKNKAAPFGYGNKIIGHRGDTGWVEYLLFSTNTELVSQNSHNIFPHDFWYGTLPALVYDLRLSNKNIFYYIFFFETVISIFNICIICV